MSKDPLHYTIIREYKNIFGINELVKRIIRSHIKNNNDNMLQISNYIVTNNQPKHSNHEVKDYERHND